VIFVIAAALILRDLLRQAEKLLRGVAARLKGAKSPVRNLVVAGAGNAGAGVEAVVISGAEAAEALVPGLLARRRSGVTEQEVAPAGDVRRQSAA
jgi:hypothetical protein